MLRRHFLASAGLLGLSAVSLTGCVTTKNGTTTTVSLDVAKVKAYGTAGINAANTVLAILAVSPSLAAYIAPVKNVLATLEQDFNAFVDSAGAAATLVYDTSSVKGVVDSLLTNLNSAQVIFESVLNTSTGSTVVPSDVVNKVNVISTSLKTIVSVFQAVLGTVITTASDSSAHLSEAQALKNLGV